MSQITENSQSKFYKIMDDMEKVYADVEQRLNEMAPRCHFRPMFLDEDDYEEWWECSVCGHTLAGGSA